MAERSAIGRRLDELPVGLAAGVGVAVGASVGAGLLLHGGVGALAGFCGAVGAATGVALTGRAVAEVVPTAKEKAAKIEVPAEVRWLTRLLGTGARARSAVSVALTAKEKATPAEVRWLARLLSAGARVRSAIRSAQTDPELKAVREAAEALDRDGAAVFAKLDGWPRPPVIHRFVPDVYALFEEREVVLDFENEKSVREEATRRRDFAFTSWAEESPGRTYEQIVIEAEKVKAPAPAHVSPRIEMVHIPGGTFLMGSEDGADGASDERPRHRVTLSPYWMAMVPVTQKLYSKVMRKNPGDPTGGDLPINQVSWFDAIRFCNRLSEREGLASAYREEQGEWIWDGEADGYRLPTEAEWEYAARGTDGRTYPWGNEPPSNQLCWDGPGNDLDHGERRNPSRVGSYPAGASPFGLLDMAGNVLEWCWDRYGSYAGSPVRDPRGAQSGDTRVRRGGSYDEPSATRVRAAARLDWPASSIDKRIGFRCARGATTPTASSGGGPK